MLTPPCLFPLPNAKNLVEMAGASAVINDLEIALRTAAHLLKEANQKDERIQKSSYCQSYHISPGMPALAESKLLS